MSVICTFNLDGTTYRFGSRLEEVQTFLFKGDAIEKAFQTLGKPQYTADERRAGLTRVKDVPVRCLSGSGPSFYRPWTWMWKSTEIVLRPSYTYYLDYANFAHLVLHEYTHALIRCDFLEPEEVSYFKKFRGGQSGVHCRDFKLALLVLDREFGLLTSEVYRELETLLSTRTWKRPYEFEKKYQTPRLSFDEAQIATRNLHLEALRVKRDKKKRSPKQLLSAYLTKRWQLHGYAYKSMGYDEREMPVKSTWTASDVGEAIAIFPIEDSVVVKFEHRTRTCGFYHLPSAVYSVEDLGSIDRVNMIDAGSMDLLIEKVVSLQEMLEAQGLSEILFAAGVCWSDLSGKSSYTGKRDCIESAVIFKWDVCSTIYTDFSDAQIDYVALYTTIYNQIANENIDYTKLTPSRYRAILWIVKDYLEALPIPLHAQGWRCQEAHDVYGDKVAVRGVLGQLREDKPLFWRGFIASRLADGAPIDIPGFFMQFSEADQGLDAEGQLSDVATHPGGGLEHYRAAVGEAHPHAGAIDSPVVAYAQGLNKEISTDREELIRDFLQQISDALGSDGVLEGACIALHQALYSEVLCVFSAVHTFDASRSAFTERARNPNAEVASFLADYEIPYTPEEFDDYFALLEIVQRGAQSNVSVADNTYVLDEDTMIKVLGAGCPTVRLLKSVGGDLYLMVFDGSQAYVGLFEPPPQGGSDLLREILKVLRGSVDMSDYMYLDLRDAARENFVRRPLALQSLEGDVADLLDMPVMSYAGTGDINLFDIDNAGVYDIVLHLRTIPSITLREILPALEGSLLVAVCAQNGQQRYYYRDAGGAFEVDSVVAWWLLYL